MPRLAPPLFAASLVLAPPALADEGTARILAPWEANGQLFQIAVDRLQFIGTFEGIMYIEHGEGLLDAALFTCPSTQIIHVLSNQMQGHGYCTIESPGGDYVYAEFNCDGEPGACTGQFALTGGTGKLTGITGQSQFVVRTALSGTAINEGGGTISATKGLAIWPEMRFQIPGRAAKSGLFGTGVTPSEPTPAGQTQIADAPAGQTQAADESATAAPTDETAPMSTDGGGASPPETLLPSPATTPAASPPASGQ